MALLLLAAAAVALAVVRRRLRASARRASTGPLPPGRLAYELTLGVGALVVGGLLLLVAAWFCVLALAAASLPGGPWGLPLILALLCGLIGMALFLLGRDRLLRL